MLKAIELDSTNMRLRNASAVHVSVKRLARSPISRHLAYARSEKTWPAQTMVDCVPHKQAAEAMTRFERIIEINPRAATPRTIWRGCMPTAPATRPGARARADGQEVLSNEPAVDDTLVDLLQEESRGGGIPLLRSSIEKDSRKPLYHYHLGLAYAKSGDKERARESLQ
jgi:hypothetical protein